MMQFFMHVSSTCLLLLWLMFTPRMMIPSAVAFSKFTTRTKTRTTLSIHKRKLSPQCLAARPSNRLFLAKTRDSAANDKDGLSYSDSDDDDDDDFSLQAFTKAKKAAQQQDEEEKFDGYALRDVILNKWGACYDVDFQRVDSFGFRKVYLNILPFQLNGRGPFRHATELDYLCHLQAVVEILQKYQQLSYVLAQIAETNKKPRAGTNPLVAVPIRLDLTPEQVAAILGY